jgi:hypothetical protein
MTTKQRTHRLALLGTLAALGAAAAAQDSHESEAVAPPPSAGTSIAPRTAVSATVRTIFSSVAGSPTADVPGYPGVHFTGTTTAFDRPFGTANGHWIITGDTDAATTADDFLLLDGLPVQREGDVAPFAVVGGSTLGPFQTRQGVNASGEYVFKNNTSEASTADDYVVKVSAGPTYTVVAMEGNDIPHLGGSELWNDNLEGVLITDNGDVAFEANLIQFPTSTANDEIYVHGASLLYLEDTTVPTGQLTGFTDPWDNLDFEDTWISADGAHVLMKGDLLNATTTTDDVLVYDGAVVLQEGFVIPGSSFTDPIDTDGIVECAMDLAGNWWARGNNDVTEDDWVVRNGVVMAKGGDPIYTGATELWDDATFTDLFFMHQGDSRGNYVIAGVTDAADTFLNGVIVLNGTTVLCREGDPVDVDNNGLFDDGMFINTFGNDDLVLNDLGELIFVATLRTSNTTTTSSAQAVIKMQAIEGPFAYCTAGTTTNGCNASISAAGFPSASAPSDFTITVSNVEGQRQGLIFYSVTGAAAAPWGGSGSFKCVLDPVQRTPQQNSNGTDGSCDGAMTLDFNDYIFTTPGALGTPFSAGDTVWAQAWFRDPPSPKTTHLSNGLEFRVGP